MQSRKARRKSSLKWWTETLNDETARTKRRRSSNRYRNDIFFASRLALNDVENTEFVASVIADMDYSTRLLGCEARRDLSDSWTATVDAAVMLKVAEEDVIHETRRDGYVLLNVTYSF